jgi:GNAT superfamily N-acetyltransferase
MNKMRIATPTDLDGINQIRAALNYPTLSESDIMPSSKRETFVATDNNKIIAYLSLHSDISFQSDNDADLDVFVLPDSQRHGIGSDLIEYAFQYASSNTMLNRLTAGVSDDNPRATSVKQFLREKIGFDFIGRYGKAECFARDVKR